MNLEDFSDAPLDDEPTLDRETQVFVVWLESLIDDPGCQYALPTLTGILANVKRLGKVSEPQRDAVQNIYDGAVKREMADARRRRSRRYEGWNR